MRTIPQYTGPNEPALYQQFVGNKWWFDFLASIQSAVQIIKARSKGERGMSSLEFVLRTVVYVKRDVVCSLMELEK